MIFVLDDSEERVRWFTKKWGKDNVNYTCNIKEAKNLLNENKYDIIFLDFDLGQKYKSGINVAFYLAKNKLQLESKIVIHSDNPVGSDHMMKILEKEYDVEYNPFSRLIKLLI
jgi:response regulator RpfG family c-di-GMP phosphodiesterase